MCTFIEIIDDLALSLLDFWIDKVVDKVIAKFRIRKR